VPVAVSIELLTGCYDAADVQDRERAEWPPHPARLFCALVAAARTEEERAALRWLEDQPAPMVYAAERAVEHRRAGFVVTNEVTNKPGSQTHPARTNGLRVRVASAPAVPTARIVWDGAPGPGVVEALDAAARRVPYLGRSTGIALIAAAAAGDGDPTGPPVGSGWSAFEPCDMPQAQTSLRVPYPGYLDQLDAQFEADRPAWEVSRSRGYRVRDHRPAAAAPPSPAVSAYPDVVVFRFAGLRPQGRLMVRFTEALRSRVLGVVGSDAPAVLHGHGADGRPHVAFLALPDVGGEHADGHLLGLAVAVPDLPADQRRRILGAVLGLRAPDAGGSVQLQVPALGDVELAYQPGLVRPWGASPQRWRRGSRRWVTATPVVLDRYPKKPEHIEAEVLRSVRMLGLPDPVNVRIGTEPLLPGAVRLRPGDLPRQVHGRPFRHVALDFDRTVAGPLLLGAGRYLGVGLLAPVSDSSDA
jgi:CRISPR-associated protein Csb2